MGHRTLEGFIRDAEGVGEAQTVEGAELDRDVGCLTELTAEVNGPALLFDRFAGFPAGYRICVNAIRTPRRFALAMGFPLDAHPVDLIRRYRERLRQMTPVGPALQADGPVFERMQQGPEVDLGHVPVPVWHDRDGGRYIGTGDLVVIRDPDGGWVNVGTYRACIQGPNRLSLWIISSKHGRILLERHWQQGRNAPVALVFGCDPLTWSCGVSARQFGNSEYELAGALHGEPLPVVALPQTQLPVPAESELVVEGEIPPLEVESVHEGPFGEWPGYYSHEGQECVVRVTGFYHRAAPILLGSPPVRPIGLGAGSSGIPSLAASLWDHLERSGVTDVAGVWGFANTLLLVVALRTRYPGHAKQALLSAAGMRGGASMYTYVVAVDDDIDPSNLNEVVWALGTRVDPETAVEVLHHAWTSDLDPRLSPDKKQRGDYTVGRLLIDACRPYAWKDRYPAANVYPREVRAAVRDKYRTLIHGLAAARP